MSEGTAVAFEKEKPERERRRRDRGTGCIYQAKFETEEDKVRNAEAVATAADHGEKKPKKIYTGVGSWRIKFAYEDPATGQKRYHDEKAPVDTKSAAVEYLIKRKAEVLAGTFRPQAKPETYTFEQMQDALLNEYEMREFRTLRIGKDKDGKRRKYISNLNHLAEFFRGHRAIRIDTDKIEGFKLEMKRAGRSNVLINRSLSKLRRMFHLAVEKGKLKADQIPTFRMLPEPDARKGFVEREQFQKLRDALPERLRTPVALAYFTGMRQGEIRRLRWENVDLFECRIRLSGSDTKNKTGRTIPMIREAVEMLSMLRAQNRTGDFVFGGSVPMGHFRKAWYSACCKSGLGRFFWTCSECDERTADKSANCAKCGKPMTRQYAGLIPHDLRRSTVRNLIRAGVSEKVSMTIVGHKTRAMLDRYNITDERDLSEAVRKMEQHNSESISQSTVKVRGFSGTVEKGTQSLVN